MNAATEVKRHKLTQEDCDTVRLLIARQRTLKEIADIIGVDSSTVGKIRLAGYDLQAYLARRKEMNRKTKERKAAEAAGARRLNELIGTQADEERDKLIYDQLVEEREAEKNGMTVEMYRFCKKMREKQETPAEVQGKGILEEVKLKDGATPTKPFKRFSTCPPAAKWLMGEEPKNMQPAEVTGQMKMDLDAPAEEPEKSDDSKRMKFQAAMVDKLVKVLTEMIVMLDNRMTALDEIRDVLKGGGKHE